MRRLNSLIVVVLTLLCCATSAATFASAAPQTVCTITVNSSDEKEAFRRYLPVGRYNFVELVERGRPDWLETARRKGIRCDVLIISGHYDGGDYAGGNEFFSEHVDSHEFLPVDEMERVSCSEPEQGLFSQLKAVYLFGCNTLNPEPLRGNVEELRRSLVQSGHSVADADRLARALSSRYADSSRDRMRHIFRNVPAIYGFSSVAPLGPVAAANLKRYFDSGGASEVASGRPSSRVLAYFPGRSLTVARGLRDDDADAGLRRDVCGFVDDRMTTAQKVEWMHQVLTRDMAEVRVFLDRLERFTASLDASTRQAEPVAMALAGIARDSDARTRYLAFLRATDRPAVRTRMIDLAADLQWLSHDERRDEIAQMMRGMMMQASISAADVDLVCRLNADGSLDDALPALPRRDEDIGAAGVRACLGSDDDQTRVLQALVGANDAGVQIAQVYVRHHPIGDVNELRRIAAGIGQMSDPVAQARALDTLAHLRLNDRETLETLTELFPSARSVTVQRAIAGILIRADFEKLDAPQVVRALQEHRLKSPDGHDLIDVLIRRLQVSS
jgi:hypothetical protein